MEAKATAKYMRVSTRKTRLVAANLRGMPVEQALNALAFAPQKPAKLLRKILHSAVANAGQLPGVDVDALRVKEIIVNEGPTWKRIMPRAMGRAYQILKRTSHITVVVEEGA